MLDGNDQYRNGISTQEIHLTYSVASFVCAVNFTFNPFRQVSLPTITYHIIKPLCQVTHIYKSAQVGTSKPFRLSQTSNLTNQGSMGLTSMWDIHMQAIP